MDRRVLSVVVVVLASLAMGVAIRFRDELNPWFANAAIAAVVIPPALYLLRDHLRNIRLTDALIGLTLGVLLVLVSHGLYDVVASSWPALDAHVAELYGGIQAQAPGTALTLVLIFVVVVAEELVWRGLCWEGLGLDKDWKRAAIASTLLYGIPQVIGGVTLLLAIALALGLVLALLRAWRKSLVAPIFAHALWSGAVFVLWPLV